MSVPLLDLKAQYAPIREEIRAAMGLSFSTSWRSAWSSGFTSRPSSWLAGTCPFSSVTTTRSPTMMSLGVMVTATVSLGTARVLEIGGLMSSLCVSMIDEAA